MNNNLIKLSASSGLGLYKDCPQCFWLHHRRGIKRPRGIFPSLPGGMDLILKKHYDKFRGSLPPELRGVVRGKLHDDLGQINQWRNWRTGLTYIDSKLNAMIIGALDDCIVSKNLFIPLDYKTKGSAPKAGDSELYYQTQLDTYALLLSANGMRKVGKEAWLVYYVPSGVSENNLIHFSTFPIAVEVNADRIKELVIKVVHCFRSEEMPSSSVTCEYCTYRGSAA